VTLTAPTALQLQQATHTGWRILVDDTDDATDAYTETAVYDTTSPSYTFSSGIVTGHSYRVKLKLCSVVGCSLESQMTNPIIAASPPAPPYPLSVLSSTNSEILVTWSYSGSNGGSQILNWKVYISADGDSWPAVTNPTFTTADVNTMQYTVTCSSVGTGRQENYIWIRIAASSTAGTGDYSEVLASRCSAVPATPLAPTKVSSSTAHITITWAYPSNTELNNALHAGTKVHFDDGAGGPFTIVTLTDIIQQEYTLTGVSAGQDYRFKIQTASEVGASAVSPELIQVAAGMPDPPVLTVAATSNTHITYNWNLLGSSGGSAIVNWRLYMSSDGVTFPTTGSPTQTMPASSSTAILDCTNFGGVNRAQQYFWTKIAGYNAAGEGAVSAALKTRCSLVPGTPVAPTRIASTANSVTIGFNTNGLNGAYLTGFKVYTNDGNNGPWTIDTITDTTARTFTKYGLLPGLPYRFKVQVVSEVGSSAISPYNTHYSAAPPDAPSLFVDSSLNTQITLKWTTLSDGGSPITQWLVYASLDGITWPAITAPTYTVTLATTIRRLAGVEFEQLISCMDPTKWGGGNVQNQYIYFKVAGVNLASTGVLSNSFRWRCSAKPDQPPQFTTANRVSGTASSVTFRYNNNHIVHGSLLTGYKFWYDDGLNGEYTKVTITSTSQTEYTVSGLKSGLPYRFAYQVLSETGESVVSLPFTQYVGADADPPGSPTWQSSGTPNANDFTITWTFTGSNGGTPITGWDIWFSDQITFPGKLKTNADININGAGTMHYILDCTNIAGLNVQNAYFYARVAAVTMASVGEYSPIARLFCSYAPQAPTVSNIAGTASSVTIGWMEGTLAGAELRGYKVYMNDGLGGSITLRAIVHDTSQRNYTATGLVADRDYLWQVSVVSAVGESSRSTQAVARSCGVPSKPMAPSRNPTGSSEVNIVMFWSAPADNGCPMTGYRLIRDDTGDGTANLEVCPGNGVDTDPLDPNLQPTLLTCPSGVAKGKTYGFKVRAFNARGYSDSAWTYVKAAAEPSQITTIQQTNALSSSTSIFLSWNVPDVNGGVMKGYKVYRDNGPGTQFLAAHDPTCGLDNTPAPPQCTITGLKNGEEYQIRVVATNDVGDGVASSVVSMRAATMPSKVTNILNTASTGTPPSVSFEWQHPSDGGAAIFNYEAQVQRVDTGIAPTWNAGGTAGTPNPVLTKTFATADGLGINTQFQYKIRLRGYNIMGYGEWSEYSSITATPRGWTLDTPITPLNFARHADIPVAGFVKLRWDPIATEPDAGRDMVNMIIYEVYGGPGTPVKIAEVPYTSTSYTATVPAGTSWSFYVKAKNRAGKLSAATTTLLMASGELPQAPASVTTASPAVGSATVTWTAVPTVGGIQVLQYEVYRDTELNLVIRPNTDTSYTYAINTFGSGQSLQFYVRARNAVGVSAPAGAATLQLIS
jgi:hypothetical protein